MALNIMLQGTMSNAGKSLLSAGLCRIFRQDGYHVAPFKSQNMALNSFITKDGGEMGRAQVVQAEACGIEPDVRMNPILLKPTTDVGSQVIVNGQVRGNMRAMEYYAKKREFLPDVMRAYESLAAENDVIVIEGAGSPAEINLKQDDFVNMGLAKLVPSSRFWKVFTPSFTGWLTRRCTEMAACQHRSARQRRFLPSAGGCPIPATWFSLKTMRSCFYRDCRRMSKMCITTTTRRTFVSFWKNMALFLNGGFHLPPRQYADLF